MVLKEEKQLQTAFSKREKNEKLPDCIYYSVHCRDSSRASYSVYPVHRRYCGGICRVLYRSSRSEDVWGDI